MDRKKDKGRLSYCRLGLVEMYQMNLRLYEKALISFIIPCSSYILLNKNIIFVVKWPSFISRISSSFVFVLFFDEFPSIFHATHTTKHFTYFFFFNHFSIQAFILRFFFQLPIAFKSFN